MGQANEFVAGIKATVLILTKDAFGNNVSSAGEGLEAYDFTISVSHSNGSVANVINLMNKGWNEFGYLSIEFIAATAGSLLLHVKDRNNTLNGSPLSFKVSPGDLLNHHLVM